MKQNLSAYTAAREFYRRGEYHNCLKEIDSALAQSPDELQTNQLLLLKGNAFLKLGQNLSARNLYFQVYRACRLAEFKGEYYDLGTKALMNAGLATKELGETETAVQFYRQVLEQRFVTDPENLSNIHSLLGNALITIDPEDSWNHLQKALTIATRHNLEYQQQLVTINIINFHLRHDELETAETLLTNTLHTMQEIPDNSRLRSRLLFNFGVLETQRSNYRRAIKYFEEALKLTVTPSERLHLLTHQADCHNKSGHRKTAESLIKEAGKLADQLQVDRSFLESIRQQILQRSPKSASFPQTVAKMLFRRHGLVGVSRHHHRLMNDIDTLAGAREPILIFGETGTGKELVARALHNSGPYRNRPFIPINCPAIPESLFESQLFGHRKGSFTGANEDRTGLIEAAGDGTIFLDEIGDLPLSIQPKLLRFLESGEFTVMGETKVRKSNARIISATNRDLQTLVEKERFREDLLQRIGVLRIRIFPLREHPEDIFFMATAFLDTLNEQHGTNKKIAADTFLFLENYHFPGNVRELKNMVLRGFQSAAREIHPEHLGVVMKNDRSREALPLGDRIDLEDLVLKYEKDLIIHYLSEYNGNQRESAARLGISLRSLKYKLQKLGIRSQTFRG